MRELLDDPSYDAETVSVEINFSDGIICPACGVDSDDADVEGVIDGTAENGTVYGFFSWNCGFCLKDVSKLMTYEIPFDEDDRD
jgi:hypothetical protein